MYLQKSTHRISHFSLNTTNLSGGKIVVTFLQMRFSSFIVECVTACFVYLFWIHDPLFHVWIFVSALYISSMFWSVDQMTLKYLLYRHFGQVWQ